ncbi:50S ribosomal protein L29 [Buchnera aphidicola str. Bp (Baizongia pistaciae)]|uniref:Large ribosomal subunit protein uL29 n=1 Tax=Buchnera aphidicola subsp. Baizongia pistaciae (strain Bp) TaxID=224915 RepID=RL29_BUCBP|nr:50S ribosomal protein L29 [Buchnera aphidicola]Q89A74.1 RecName: Full=Large ribosomal subunit protein uL29; AltName: Full=50S ribosomal protein L29 [Buchnera aphidicola str. Bp (Baizongia pistaciae)]AAO27165.1 50S ribosomal protein L29 [Buchnera aphidicola str. Bp (Baizongia pistaciae)]
MKKVEIKKKTIKELNIELMNLLREQFNLTLQHSAKKLQQSHLLQHVRRNIAQVNTILAEKEKECD